MHSIISGLTTKETDSRIMLDLLQELETTPHRDSVLRCAVLKSTHILTLYNVIESTVTEALTIIHDRIRMTPYSRLTDNIQHLWITYFFMEQKHSECHQNLNKTISGSVTFPSLPDYLKKSKIYSGNLDGSKIRQIMKDYGIKILDNPEQEKLIDIKKKRNILAHGEAPFKDACRAYSYNEIEILQNACFTTMKLFVANVNDFLQNTKYIRV